MPGIDWPPVHDSGANRALLEQMLGAPHPKPVVQIDYEKLASAIVDEMERREVVRGERLISTKKRV